MEGSQKSFSRFYTGRQETKLSKLCNKSIKKQSLGKKYLIYGSGNSLTLLIGQVQYFHRKKDVKLNYVVIETNVRGNCDSHAGSFTRRYIHQINSNKKKNMRLKQNTEQ